MKTTLSRRGLIRFASFMTAIVAVLAISNAIYMKKIKRLEYSVEAGYGSAIEDLAQSADKISSILLKGSYASSPSMMTRLSGELTECSGRAKSALQSLPVYGMSLDNLEKFFSQVGNYARSLSKRATAGEEISAEDREAVKKLCGCADSLSESLWELRGKFMSSDYTLGELFNNLDGAASGFISDGFSGIEDNLSEMPKLIYDGPFSDHILERTPAMTANAEEVEVGEAMKKAAAALDTEEKRILRCEAEEEGKMPSYCFYSEGGRCAVSKNGGYIVYCIKSRGVEDSALSCEEAVNRADEYLKALGIENMESTYYECYNNVCTVNYAYTADGVTYYTDLVKVAVALDDGEILGFDARGYLVNHRERSFEDPAYTEEEVLDNVSGSLRAESCRLAVIPSDSVEEKLCYEIKCSDGERNVLVYVNAATGEEEDILLLIESDSGVLTV